MKPLYILTLAACLAAGCSEDNCQFDASGTFEATEVLVSAEATGKLLRLDVREGDRLAVGQEVGCVDSIQLYWTKKQLEAGMSAIDVRRPDIQKQIAVLEQQIATARTEQQRQSNLVKAHAGNQKNLDDCNHQLEFLQKQLAAHRSTLDKSNQGADAETRRIQYQLMQLDDQLLKCHIINPHAGVVLTRYAEAGEFVSPGKPVYKIADTDLLYLRAYITADQLSQLRVGQTLRVFADYAEDYKEYEGILTWISDKAEFSPKGIQTKDERADRVYAIKIAVKNDGALKIGQYGEVRWSKIE